MPLKGRKSVLQAVDNLTEKREKQLRGIFLKGLSNIALGTPVAEGRARNSWFFSNNSPAVSGGERSASKSGSASISSAMKMPKDIFKRKMFYTNNMPYINKLEYGGFPNPSDGKKTINGFSDQAEKGWVRGELGKMRKAIRNIK